MNYSELNAQLGAKEKKATVVGHISADKDFITLKVPRHLKLSDLRTGEKSLFAAVQANPGNGVSLMVTDEESRKVIEVPCDRLINFNLFATWAKHNIVGALEDKAPAQVKA